MLLLVSVTTGVLTLVAVLLGWTVIKLNDALRQREAEATATRAIQILNTLAPGVASSRTDPTAILSWQPVAATARALFPHEFERLDRAAGSPFPFSPKQIQDAHSAWTADWLAWEQAHDHAFKLRVAEAQADLAVINTPLARAKLDAVEREKLALYQARYGRYIQVAKALQSLLTTVS